MNEEYEVIKAQVLAWHAIPDDDFHMCLNCETREGSYCRIHDPWIIADYALKLVQLADRS